MRMQQLIDGYLAGPKALRQAVTGMSQEQILARPLPGKWSTLEVVCHLADFEPVYADRMKRIIAEDQPVFMSADEQRYAASLAYQDRNLEEELSLIEHTRNQLARILRKLPAEVLERTGIYRHEGKDDPRTLEGLLTIITNHIPHHAKFIREKRRAFGLPDQ